MTRTEAISTFRKLFERFSYRQDYSTVFNSFLDFALFNLTINGRELMEDAWRRLDEMYPKEDAAIMAQMFDAWSAASDNDGEGLYDALGDLFMDCVSFGRNGQFFTPQPVCDMMAEITYGDQLTDGKSVSDCACGSGRMLLAMAKKNRRMRFYGADNDNTCAKMAALNLVVNSMPGEIAWMDSLTLEHYRSYHITLAPFGTHYIPMLSITDKDQTFMIGKVRASFAQMNGPAAAVVESESDLIINKKGQIALF